MSQTDDDRYLDVIGILYYVLGGIVGLCSLFPGIYILIGLAALTGNMNEMPPGEAKVFGGVFVGIGGLFMLIGFGLAVCAILTGMKLRARRSHTFCLVMAAISCLFMPLGTALGIFAIIVLVKPEVRAAFGNPRSNSGGGWS